ncbi:MAG: glutamine amidotransferase-related protein, partial [Rhodanobacter sp.]
MDLLDASGMRKLLERLVMQDKVPVLGICVGMQILADSSEEGVKPGLGWVKGQVRSFAGNAASAA